MRNAVGKQGQYACTRESRKLAQPQNASAKIVAVPPALSHIPTVPHQEHLPPRVRSTLHEGARGAGRILINYLGKISHLRHKAGTSSIVCEADLASERYTLNLIRGRFPQDGIVAEESGYHPGKSRYTWIIDPLDGTSNFVAGLPWFGVQLGLLRDGLPVAGIMHLPLEKATYYAEAGRGATRNGIPVRTNGESRTQNVLCSFGFDPDSRTLPRSESMQLLLRLSGGVRNVRATNSLVDFCYTVDGRLGGCVNLCTRIWDIVPASVILPEAGGKFSGLRGERLEFDLARSAIGRNYAVVGAAGQLHSRLLQLLHRSR